MRDQSRSAEILIGNLGRSVFDAEIMPRFDTLSEGELRVSFWAHRQDQCTDRIGLDTRIKQSSSTFNSIPGSDLLNCAHRSTFVLVGDVIPISLHWMTA